MGWWLLLLLSWLWLWLWLWLLFQTRLMTVYDHVKSAMQRVTETNLCDSRRPRHPPSPRQRRTLRRRELPKNQLAQCADCEKDYKNTRGKIVQVFEEELLGEASTVHTSSFCETSGTQREVRNHQQNQEKTCHCRGRRRAWPLRRNFNNLLQDLRHGDVHKTGRESTSGADT